MKKAFKKLSVISLFVLIALLSSCDPEFDNTYKIKNELGRDIKTVDGLDTITIKNGEVKTVLHETGLGESQFARTSEYLDRYPIIFFDDSVVYKSENIELIKTFERSIFKRSCWEILCLSDKIGSIYEALYLITEEDYQNAIILNGTNK